MAKKQIKGLRYPAWAGVLLILLVAAPLTYAGTNEPPAVQVPLINTPLDKPVLTSVSLPEVILGLLGASALGTLAGWQITKRKRTDPEPASVPIHVTSATCKTATVSWHIAADVRQRLASQGETLMVRLYAASSESLSDFIAQLYCAGQGSDLQVPIPVSDRAYKIELGTISAPSTWRSLAWSAPVHIPACEPSPQTVEPQPLWLGKEHHLNFASHNYIILTSSSTDDLYAIWHISPERRAQALQQGGCKQMLRIHDVTGATSGDRTAHKTWQYACNSDRDELHILMSRRNRDYMAELGYITANGRWLSLAHSTMTRVTDQPVPPPLGTSLTRLNPIPHPSQSSSKPLVRPQNQTKHDKP